MIPRRTEGRSCEGWSWYIVRISVIAEVANERILVGLQIFERVLSRLESCPRQCLNHCRRPNRAYGCFVCDSSGAFVDDFWNTHRKNHSVGNASLKGPAPSLINSVAMVAPTGSRINVGVNRGAHGVISTRGFP